MLWGPPDTLTKRTVVPGLIVSLSGSKAAWVVPFPVIFTSTTGPPCSAAGAAGCAAEADALGAAGAAAAWDAWGLLSPPQASVLAATSVLSRINRIAVLRCDGW